MKHSYLSEMMLDTGLEKQAGPGLDAAIKAISNTPTIAGAGLGAAYGGYKGAKDAGENQGAAGALGGALVGGVAGGFLGGGLRNIYKNVPKGYKDWKAGNEALTKELKSKGKLTEEEAKFFTRDNLKSYIPFTEKSKRYQYVQGKGDSYKRMSEQMGAGKTGQDLVKADDKALKQIGAYGDVVAGRRRMIGGALGGGIAAGYGGYQLKSTGDIAKKTQEEKHLDNVENIVNRRKALNRNQSVRAIERRRTGATATAAGVGRTLVGG